MHVDTHRFAVYKEQVVDLLTRVTMVSAAPEGITNARRWRHEDPPVHTGYIEKKSKNGL